MTPDEQRIALAELCGWKDIYRGSRKGNAATNGNTLWATKDAPSTNYPREYSVVPDYLNDLNAVHEAEKMLTDEQRERYANTLYRMPAFDAIKDTYEDILFDAVFKLIHATAAQRTEALLRTLGRWGGTQ